MMRSFKGRVAVVACGGVALLLAAWWLGRADEHVRQVGSPGEGSTSALATTQLEPEWGRCVEVRGTSPPTCVYDPERPLRLWFSGAGVEEAVVFVDGALAAFERYEAPEMVGFGLRLAPPPLASELRVELPGAEPWTLGLQSTREPDPSSAEVEAIDALMGRANRLYGAGTDWRAAKALADQAIEHARRAGLTSKMLDVALMSVFYLGWQVKRPDLARQLLSEIGAEAMSSPQGRADWEASSGHVWWGQGDLTAAAQAYRAASRYAVRMQDERLIVEAMPMYAAALAELGYFRAAARWSSHALDFVEPGSEIHGQVLETAGWVNLVLRRDGHEHEDPIALYQRAVGIFGPDGSFPAPGRIGAAILGIAEARLLDGEPDAARGWLEQLVDERLTLDDLAYRYDLDLRVGLLLGDPEAELHAGLRQLERAAERAASPEAWWWFYMRRGDVLGHAGRWDAAVAAYRSAELRLDEIARLAAFGVGRWAVGESHRTGAIRLAEALLELRRPEQALCALREAEGRRVQPPVVGRLDPVLRALSNEYVRKKTELEDAAWDSKYATVSERREVQARIAHELEQLRERINSVLHVAGRSWARPRCEELAARQPGELILGLYAGGDGWLVFGQDERGVVAFRVAGVEVPNDPMGRKRLSGSVLSLLDPQLRRAHRVRVLASGPAREVDVHTLPWHGRPLLDAVTVAYGSEVVSSPRRSQPRQPLALLIADPLRTLPGAEEEVTAVARTLEGIGYSVVALPQERALPATVRPLLEQASLLHFSGHTEYPGVEEHGLWPPYAGGTPGVASHLVLAGGQQLAIHDILLISKAPEIVVLAGCEAGALDPGIGGESLALAFVASGSQVVIASPDVLHDDIAALLGQEFYAGPSGAIELDAAEALRRAQRVLWDDYASPETHIGRYRAWVP